MIIRKVAQHDHLPHDGINDLTDLLDHAKESGEADVTVKHEEPHEVGGDTGGDDLDLGLDELLGLIDGHGNHRATETDDAPMDLDFLDGGDAGLTGDGFPMDIDFADGTSGGKPEGHLDIVMEPEGDGQAPELEINGHDIPLDGVADLDGEDTGLPALGDEAGAVDGLRDTGHQDFNSDTGSFSELSLDGNLDGELDAGATGQGNHPDTAGGIAGDSGTGDCADCCRSNKLVEKNNDDDFEHLLLVAGPDNAI